MSISGSCHCGNIQYQLTPGVKQEELGYRQCTCSFCTKVGAIYTSDPAGTLRIEVKTPAKITTYQFASREIDFVFCSICGIMPFAKIRIGDQHYGVVNVRTSNIDLSGIKVTTLKIAEETAGQGMARRQKTWTPIT